MSLNYLSASNLAILDPSDNKNRLAQRKRKRDSKRDSKDSKRSSDSLKCLEHPIASNSTAIAVEIPIWSEKAEYQSSTKAKNSIISEL